MLKHGFPYYIYSPEIYLETFIKGLLLPSRYTENVEMYHSLCDNRGYEEYGQASYCDELNPCVSFESFEANCVLEGYLKKIIELCDANHIKFIMKNAPLNENSYKKLKPQLVKGYTSWLDRIQREYPSAIIDTELFICRNEYFGDAIHLNKRGSIRFSQEMRRKYKYIFEP